jgi:hypothetical protein
MQSEQNLGSAVPPSGQAPVSHASQPAEQSSAPQPVAYAADQQAHLSSLVSGKYKEGLEKGEQKGYERGLKEAQERALQQAQVPVQPVPSYIPQHQPAQQPTPVPMDPQVHQQMIDASVRQALSSFVTQKQQEFETQQKQKEAQQLVADLTPKVQAAQKKYADFNERVNLEAFQGDEWFKVLNTVDNPGDVIYDLMDKTAQFTSLETLLNSGNKAKIDMAKKKLHDLSVSLKNNESSAAKKIPNDPLREVRPSKASSSGDVNLTKAAREKYANRF